VSTLPRFVVLLVAMAACETAGADFETGHASFSIRVNDVYIPYRVFAIYVLPGESVEIAAVGTSLAPGAMTASVGDISSNDGGGWVWQAPRAPGLATVVVRSAVDEIRLNAFVMYPAARIEDERIGEFRTRSIFRRTGSSS
jgi:hypothetical protein